MLEALVGQSAAPQVLANFGPDMGYDMEQEARGHAVLFRFTRRSK